MKKLMFAMCLAATSVFAAPQIPQSGEVIQIDDYQFVVLSVSDYERLARSVNYCLERINAANSNETGRTALHGRRGHTTITNGTITVEYADGYTHTEAVKANAVKREIPAGRKTKEARPLTEFEQKRAELQKRRAEAAKTVKEVTVTKEVK